MQFVSSTGNVMVRYLGITAFVTRHLTGEIDDLGYLGKWWEPEYLEWHIKYKLAQAKRRYGRMWRQYFNPMPDVVNYTGLAVITGALVNLTLPPKYLSSGTGAGAAAQGNTTLSTEAYSSSNDGIHNTRVTGASSVTTTTTAGDTMTITGAWQAPSGIPRAVTNFGIFDTNGQAADLVTPPSGGNLVVSSSFSVINLAQLDSITYTAHLVTA